MSETIVRISNLTKSFGKLKAVDGINLEIPKGSVMALLGPNGAGKTTTIKMMMDLTRPDSGSITVMGLDPARDGVEIRRRCGYVPERPKMIPWMSIRQIISFVSSFYPNWDAAYAESLRKQFNLEESQKVKSLSRGQEAKLALVTGLAHRPEFIILDDATSGIDPAARKDIMETVIGHLHAEGSTILFATHMLNEIEGLADVAAFLINGKILRCEKLEDLKSKLKRIVLWSDHPAPKLPEKAVVVKSSHSARCFEWIVDGFQPEEWQTIKSEGEFEIHDLSLEEIYLALHDRKAG